MTDKTSHLALEIARQNDRFRLNPATGGITGQVVFTRGIAALPEEDQVKIFTTIRYFADFNEDNDPYGWHDFGAFNHADHKIFWKIDMYDCDYRLGSADPANIEQTRRVLTIMLAEEW